MLVLANPQQVRQTSIKKGILRHSVSVCNPTEQLASVLQPMPIQKCDVVEQVHDQPEDKSVQYKGIDTKTCLPEGSMLTMVQPKITLDGPQSLPTD